MHVHFCPVRSRSAQPWLQRKQLEWGKCRHRQWADIKRFVAPICAHVFVANSVQTHQCLAACNIVIQRRWKILPESGLNRLLHVCAGRYGHRSGGRNMYGSGSRVGSGAGSGAGSASRGAAVGFGAPAATAAIPGIAGVTPPIVGGLAPSFPVGRPNALRPPPDYVCNTCKQKGAFS